VLWLSIRYSPSFLDAIGKLELQRTAAISDIEHDAEYMDFIRSSRLFSHRQDDFLLHSQLIQISCLNPLTNSMLLDFGITLCLRTIFHVLRTALKCLKRYSEERESIAFFCYHHIHAFVLHDQVGRGNINLGTSS
jgi:hypothetical protein